MAAPYKPSNPGSSLYAPRTSGKKILPRKTLGLLVILLTGWSLLLLPGLKGTAAAEEKDPRLATALFAEGTLIVARADGSIKRLSGQGSIPLYEGDKLETGRVSQGYLIFIDGSRMALNNNTTLILRQIKDDQGLAQMIKLAAGEIWVKTAKKTKRWGVETPNAIAGISGTEFDLFYAKGKSSPEEEIGFLRGCLTPQERALLEECILTVGEGEMDFLPLPTDPDYIWVKLFIYLLTGDRVRVPADHQSRIIGKERPTTPVKINVEPILRWGRSLDARFSPRGLDELDQSPKGFPGKKDFKPGGSSHP